MIEPAPLGSLPLTITRGFVVAGGRSVRMGQDKARLSYGGATLLDHAIGNARRVTPEVHILCGASRRYEDFGVPVIEDAVCGVGPLGGLYSALLSASLDGRERIFWLAVDLPLVPPSLIADLVASLDGADVAMAQTEQGPEPLCAAFRTEPALACVRQALLHSQLKLTSALGILKHTVVKADIKAFTNVNTKADYDALDEGSGFLPGSQGKGRGTVSSPG